MEERLPEGWVLAKLRDIVFPGDTRHPGRSTEPDFLYVDIEALDNRQQRIVAPKKILSREAPGRARLVIRKNDVIFSLTRPYLKNIAIVPEELDNQIASTAYCILRPEDGILSHFVFYLVTRETFINSIPTYGDSPPAAHDDEFLSMDVPVAPINEQSRIVAAIEQQFTRLDNAVASLQSAQARVKQYRASLLKAAVEGEVTKEWRAEHPTEESGEQLLRHILAERRARWEEEQLAKMREKGITPRDTKWKEAYKEPQGPDVENLPGLPEGWCWTNLGQCFEVHVGATPSRKEAAYWSGSIPWISSGEVQFCHIKETKETITEAGLKNSSTQLNPAGSVLLGMIGEGKTRGQVAILDIDACNSQNSAAIWVSQTPILPSYIYHLLWSQYEVIRQKGSGNNQPALNKARVQEISFPLPPLIEQEIIVAEVEAGLSNIAKLEEATENNLKRAEHERQSILQEAFAGRLVPQNPNDEPASLLLERIREERKKRAEVEKVTKISRKGDRMKTVKRRKIDRAANGQQSAGLYEKLVEAGEPLTPDDLFKQVGLQTDEQPESVEGFYEELHTDVTAGLIEEERPARDKVLLSAVEQDEEELEIDEELAESDILPVGEMRHEREELFPNLDELPVGEMRQEREELFSNLDELPVGEMRQEREFPLFNPEELPKGQPRQERDEEIRRTLWDD